METTDGEWQCENKRCAFVNKNDIYRCPKCDTIRPYIPSTVGQPCIEDSLPDTVSLGATSLNYKVTSIKSSADNARQPRLVPGAPLQDEEFAFPDQECRLVLLGKTGNGKSSTGNTIVNASQFPVGRGMASSTKKCHRHSAKRFGINVEVVDTPGFYDTEDDDDEIRREVMKCVGIVSPGPHAILLVVRLDVRFTEEEARSVQEVRNLFGDVIMRHVIIVFTHGDKLEHAVDEAPALQESLEGCPEELSNLMKETDNRYVVFNNKGSAAVRTKQVRQLFLTIREMLSGTGGQPFTSHFLQQCEKEVALNAAQLGDLLDSKTVTNQHLRDMIRAGLEGRGTLETVFQQVLDQQDKDQKRAEKAENQAEILKKEAEILKKEAESLKKKTEVLEGRDLLLHEVLDQQDKDQKRAEKAEKEAESLKKKAESLEGRDSLLHEVLDQQDRDQKRAEKAEKEAERLKRDAETLKTALEVSRRLQSQLEEKLLKEQAKICLIL